MDLLGTDATKVAGAYAAFAGVLAGFVFAVMGYLLGNRRPGADHHERENLDIALSWAVLAFVGLSIASFLFALLSGEDRFGLPIGPTGVGPTRIRPIVLDIVASGVLSIAVLALLLALNWLFASERVSQSLFWQLRVVEWLVGLLTLFYLDGTFLAVSVAEKKIAVDDLGPLALLGGTFLLAILLGEVVGGLLRRSLRQASDASKQAARVVTQFLLLILFCASAVLFNFIDFANEAGSGTWPVTDFQWLGVGVLGIVLFLCVLNLPPRPAKDLKLASSHIS